MVVEVLSIGDVLMLSQQAWKIGRAFTHGRGGASSEFGEVEREANALSDALKLTAETLHSDGSILERAEHETRDAVNSILESAQRTLGDLESFIERYQVIRKRQTSGGFVVERSWSEVIIANYRTIKWTTEGGNITDLRNMLHMHTNTIILTMQALQTKSLSRLERTVMPMAENIASIHSRVNGDLADKVDDLHQLMMSLASGTPSLNAQDRAVEDANGRRRSTFSVLDHEAKDNNIRMQDARHGRPTDSTPSMQQKQKNCESVQSTPTFATGMPPRVVSSARKEKRASAARDERSLDRDLATGNPLRSRDSHGSATSSSRRSEGAAFDASFAHRRKSSAAKRESTTLTNLMGANSSDETAARSDRGQYLENPSIISEGGSASHTSQSLPYSHRLGIDQQMLPGTAFALHSSPSDKQTPSTPLSSIRHRSQSYTDNDHSTYSHTGHTPRANSTPASPGLASLATFERALFRNAAILCDVQAKLVEYAQKKPDEPDPRYDVEMVKASEDCRVRVIRKREYRAHGGTKLTTSIWAISGDGSVRCQLKLSDFSETVPYCSCFEQEKVSIPPNESGEIFLKFHGEGWTDDLEKEIKTNWVNYVFVSETDAAAFQSAVYGRQLLASFRTTKTIVIHDGIMRTFALEEQFANIEMLRLWEDDGVATPGAQGGVLALMHVSSNFGEGWAKWWMNCSSQQVRVKGDGSKHAKLKGINVNVAKPGSAITRTPTIATNGDLQRVDTQDVAARRNSEGRRVTGVKIEFKTGAEQHEFIEMSHRLHQRMLPLPDL